MRCFVPQVSSLALTFALPWPHKHPARLPTSGWNKTTTTPLLLAAAAVVAVVVDMVAAR
jgi:hypothetical protein